MLKKSFTLIKHGVTSLINIAIESISQHFRNEIEQSADIELPELNVDRVQPENAIAE